MEIWKKVINISRYPSQSQVSKYFFFYLNVGEISHPFFRYTELTAVRRETEGDKKTKCLEYFPVRLKSPGSGA